MRAKETYRDVYKYFATLHSESCTPQRTLDRPSSLHGEVYHGDQVLLGSSQVGDVTEKHLPCSICGAAALLLHAALGPCMRSAGILPMERTLESFIAGCGGRHSASTVKFIRLPQDCSSTDRVETEGPQVIISSKDAHDGGQRFRLPTVRTLRSTVYGTFCINEQDDGRPHHCRDCEISDSLRLTTHLGRYLMLWNMYQVGTARETVGR